MLERIFSMAGMVVLPCWSLPDATHCSGCWLAFILVLQATVWTNQIPRRTRRL